VSGLAATAVSLVVEVLNGRHVLVLRDTGWRLAAHSKATKDLAERGEGVTATSGALRPGARREAERAGEADHAQSGSINLAFEALCYPYVLRLSFVDNYRFNRAKKLSRATAAQSRDPVQLKACVNPEPAVEPLLLRSEERGCLGHGNDLGLVGIVAVPASHDARRARGEDVLQPVGALTVGERYVSAATVFNRDNRGLV
jgi:hypothetical protein